MVAQVSKRYTLADYRLEPDKQLLSHGGQSIHLAKKPFQVLLYLIEHHDRFVSRSELLDHFWEGREVYDEALRKCIGAIRKALDDRLERPRFIETRWGVGYRYIGPLEEQVVREETAAVEIEKSRGIKIVVEEEEIQDEATAGGKVIGRPSLPALGSLPPTAPKSHTAILPLLLALAATITIAAVALLIYRGRLLDSSTARQAAPIHSIAVLPLKNLTADPANEYLSDGITDNLITALSKVEGLKVISRGSVSIFKGEDVDPREVGKRLGVAALLEGAMLKSNDHVRIQVRLVRTSDGRVLWATDTYDRDVKDIFDIQEEVASHVASGLMFKLSGEAQQRLAKRYTENVDAYQAYLKGRYFWEKKDRDSLKKAKEYFEKAIEKDSRYAPAYAGLADYHITAMWFLSLPSKEAIPQAQAAAIKAVEIDGTLAQAHVALSSIYGNSWNLTDAAREQKRAIEIDPNNWEAHQSYAYTLVLTGRGDEAITEIEQARELNPLSVPVNINLGEILLFARRYDEAIRALKHAIEMDPSRWNAHGDLSIAYQQKGMESEAIAEELEAGSLRYDGAERVAALRRVAQLREAYDRSGIRGFWQKQLELAKEDLKHGYVEPFWVAKIYAHLGEKDQAFAWLEKAYAEHSSFLIDLKVDPELDSLRPDPRFIDLLQRVGFDK